MINILLRLPLDSLMVLRCLDYFFEIGQLLSFSSVAKLAQFNKVFLVHFTCFQSTSTSTKDRLIKVHQTTLRTLNNTVCDLWSQTAAYTYCSTSQIYVRFRFEFRNIILAISPYLPSDNLANMLLNIEIVFSERSPSLLLSGCQPATLGPCIFPTSMISRPARFI